METAAPIAAALEFLPGDVLAFSGRGWISAAIELFTCSRYSHVGICAEMDDRVLLVESTTLDSEPCEITGKHVRGVQAHTPATRIAGYNGRIWLLRLTTPVAPWESDLLSAWLRPRLGVSYDDRAAILSATRALKYMTRQDFDRLFCAELTAAPIAMLRGLGCHELYAPSLFTPSHLLHELLEQEIYQHPVRIK